MTINFAYNCIYVDIDSKNKGKTIEGNDIFWFCISDNDLKPYSGYIDLYLSSLSNFNWHHNYATPVLWVIQNGNMDYLKCPEDLNWENQTSCK